MKRLLKGGRVVDPANGIDGIHDVLIDGDRIQRVGRGLTQPTEATVLDATGKVAEGFRAQAVQVMENIKTALEAHGYKMSDLVKCTVMLADMSEWAAFNDVYKTFFTGHFPARSAFGANGLALGARVEVECIAAVAK